MKKIAVLVAGFIFSLGLSAQINDPNAQVRQVKNFHGINVSNAFDVYINQSNDDAVAVQPPVQGVRSGPGGGRADLRLSALQ